MFFISFQEFLSDLKTIIADPADPDVKIHSSEKSADPNIVVMGPSKADKREATIRTVAQLVLTLFVVVLCLLVVIDTEPTDTANKLAFAGFGIVFGYWFR